MSKTPIMLAVFFAVCLLLVTGCDEMFGEPIFRVSKACFAYGKSHCEGNTLVLTTQDTQCRINTTRGDCDYGCIDEKSVGRCLSAEEQARRGRGVDFSERKAGGGGGGGDLVTPACRDGMDNDGDGPIDMADPGCSDPDDTSEADGGGPYCGDGTCNGGETHGSCPADCPLGTVCGDGVCGGSETCGTCSADCGTCTITYVQCNNSRDDDRDGKIDYANDYGCSSPGDDSEADPSTIPSCAAYYRNPDAYCVEDLDVARDECARRGILRPASLEILGGCSIPCSVVSLAGPEMVYADAHTFQPAPELADEYTLGDNLAIDGGAFEERLIAVDPAFAAGGDGLTEDAFFEEEAMVLVPHAVAPLVTGEITGPMVPGSPVESISQDAIDVIDVAHIEAPPVAIIPTGPCCVICVP
ncbi:hypothetical protein KY359_03755 [Candidatus Woesearchaeota archaeon]|nr:hypothetical protein [Candidatus Woesearchaeota archaeon]